MARRINPYNPAASAEETFVGRNQQLRQLVSGLGEGQSFALVGPPRIGKTSLVKQIHRQLLESCRRRKRPPFRLPVYADCPRDPAGIEEVLKMVVEAIADAMSVHLSQLVPQDIRQDCLADAKQNRLDRGLDALLSWALEKGKCRFQITLLLDSLHRLAKGSILPALAAKLYPLVGHERVNILWAARRSLAAELRNDASRLADLLTQQVNLQPLLEEETKRLTVLAKEHGWPVEDDFAAEIFRLTGGHPYRLQYLLQGILSGHNKLSTKGLREVHAANKDYLDQMLQEEDQQQTSAALVFISYSHKDEDEKNELLTHLQVLEFAGPVQAWSDDQIAGGAAWEEEIRKVLQNARVAVLLVSANFLTSEFILTRELPLITDAARVRGLHILPIIAKHCDWTSHDWLKRMNARPKNGAPIWASGSDVNEHLANIVAEIRKMLKC